MFQARGHHQSFWSFLSEVMKANFNQHLTTMISNQFFIMNEEMLTKHSNLILWSYKSSAFRSWNFSWFEVQGHNSIILVSKYWSYIEYREFNHAIEEYFSDIGILLTFGSLRKIVDTRLQFPVFGILHLSGGHNYNHNIAINNNKFPLRWTWIQ